MRRSLAGLAAATVLLAVAACGSEEPADGTPSSTGTTKVAVGVIPIVDVAPIYLGKDKGFFSKRGIELTLTPAQGGAAIVPGVVSGQFQFGFSNVTSLMIAQTKAVPIKVVANGVASTGKSGADFGAVVVKGDSPIQSAKDLAGRKVAVNTLKNIGDTTVRESVRKAGGDPAGIQFVEIGFPQMAAALDNGQVDAAWVVEPTLSATKAAGARPVAWNFVDAAPDLTVAVYFTSTKLTQENPELVRRFAEAINESLQYADTHPDEVRAVLGSYTQISEELRTSMTLPKWPTQINKTSIEALARLGQSDGVFTTAPDLSALLP
ncbi:ABC transporter substrate-binding protein [Luedemannella flava]|uniref:ABC transporter substrate-binding protein n=1 Tax=Luedemannella flava TaxID=349316 RepID=A0ABN2LN50_9ACTN